MKRFTAGALLVIVALIAFSSAASATPVAPKSKAPKLGARLLTIGQMPVGWSVDSSTGTGIGCLSTILEPKGIKQTASASVTYADGGNVPQIEEKLATFSGSTSAAFMKIVAALRACKNVSGSVNGHKATGTIGQMSFPSYGNQSSAFDVNFTVEGLTLGEYVVVVRKGDVILGMAEGNLGSPSLRQFEKYIKLALAKVS